MRRPIRHLLFGLVLGMSTLPSLAARAEPPPPLAPVANELPPAPAIPPLVKELRSPGMLVGGAGLAAGGVTSTFFGAIFVKAGTSLQKSEPDAGGEGIAKMGVGMLIPGVCALAASVPMIYFGRREVVRAPVRLGAPTSTRAPAGPPTMTRSRGLMAGGALAAALGVGQIGGAFVAFHYEFGGSGSTVGPFAALGSTLAIGGVGSVAAGIQMLAVGAQKRPTGPSPGDALVTPQISVGPGSAALRWTF